jgi:hypothetical protein
MPTTVRNTDILFNDNTTQSSAARSFMSETRTISSNYTVTAADDNALLIVTNASVVTLPALSSVRDGFAVVVEAPISNEVIVRPSSGQTINGLSGISVFRGKTIILVRAASQWKEVGSSVRDLAQRVVSLSSSGTYTPPNGVVAVLFCVVGANTYVRNNRGPDSRGGGGGCGYSEKFVVSPSGSYTFVSGARAGSLRFTTAATAGTTTLSGSGVSISVSGATATSTATGGNGGVGSGGDFNATGGAGGNASSTGSSGSRSGGNGGSACRAGDGGAGGNGVASGVVGAGGGTGGNNAVTNTPGAAATTEASGTYPLSLFTSVGFTAGTQEDSYSNFNGQGALPRQSLSDGPFVYPLLQQVVTNPNASQTRFAIGGTPAVAELFFQYGGDGMLNVVEFYA